MARPRKITVARRKRIAVHLRRNKPQETACRLEGVSPATYYEWRAHGRKALEAANGIKARLVKADLPYVEFLEVTENARAEAEQSMIDLVRQIARDGEKDADRLRAATFMLDRMYPDRWAQRKHLEVTGAQEGPIEIRVEYEPGDIEREEDAA